MDRLSEGLHCQVELPSFLGPPPVMEEVEARSQEVPPCPCTLQARRLTPCQSQTSINSDSLSWGISNHAITYRGLGRNRLPCLLFSKKKDPLNSMELGPQGMSQGTRGWLLLVCPQEARLGTSPEGKEFYCPLLKGPRPQGQQSRRNTPSPFLASLPEAVWTSSRRTGASFSAERNGKRRNSD